VSKKFKVPEAIQILDHTVQVTREFQERWGDPYGKYGACEMETQTIYVDPDIPRDFAAQVILHESIHAIEGILRLPLDDDTVDNLALGILSLIRNNPELMRELRKKETLTETAP
jgi:hypothetical protein